MASPYDPQPSQQTRDNLEALLLERASIPNERLKKLAAKYPPPQAWYDEADVPPAADNAVPDER